jgi:hypothetical protein
MTLIHTIAKADIFGGRAAIYGREKDEESSFPRAAGSRAAQRSALK